MPNIKNIHRRSSIWYIILATEKYNIKRKHLYALNSYHKSLKF